ncbi:MAG TPA: DNA-3-methyladenine glycosylase I [Ktedonosporobacter sp.]|nr:DNA-3-methyladenine glycosylase I [Ktedonosporobacter sp.]
MPERCAWSHSSQLYMDYHDLEWGVPAHDDQRLFEMLILEGAQAGLSWSTILNKRVAYREAFDHFDARLVASYDEQKYQELLQNAGIVRNRQKIQAAIQNARIFLQVQERYGSFDTFIWQFVDGRPIQNSWQSLKEVPATTKESDAMSKALQKLGFKFVGTTICYALMQAVGLVNDHVVDCFRWQEVQGLAVSEPGMK